MYITINNIKGEKRIDLSYSIQNFDSRMEIAVIRMLSDNVQYQILKLHLVMGPILDTKKMIPKLRGITEMSLNLDKLDDSDNLEDGRPSNTLLTYHMTSNEDFTHFEPDIPQCKKLKSGDFTSLTLKITDQAGNIITDGLQVTVVLHIHDPKL